MPSLKPPVQLRGMALAVEIFVSENGYGVDVIGYRISEARQSRRGTEKFMLDGELSSEPKVAQLTDYL